jgi:hypothetical protein
MYCMFSIKYVKSRNQDKGRESTFAEASAVETRAKRRDDRSLDVRVEVAVDEASRGPRGHSCKVGDAFDCAGRTENQWRHGEPVDAPDVGHEGPRDDIELEDLVREPRTEDGGRQRAISDGMTTRHMETPPAWHVRGPRRGRSSARAVRRRTGSTSRPVERPVESMNVSGRRQSPSRRPTAVRRVPWT